MNVAIDASLSNVSITTLVLFSLCSGIVNLATWLEVLECTSYTTGGTMTKRTIRTFSPEFKLETAQLVVDQRYSVLEAAQAMNVSKSAMDKWVAA